MVYGPNFMAALARMEGLEAICRGTDFGVTEPPRETDSTSIDIRPSWKAPKE